MSERRIVVTGMGTVTPFGIGVDCFWDGLIEGRNGISTITLFDVSQHGVRFGGQIQGYDPIQHFDRKTVKRLDRFAQFALIAMAEAHKSSGIILDKEDVYRIATVFGTGIGGLNELESQHSRLTDKGPSKVSAFTIPKLMGNAASGNISIEYGLKGNSMAVSTACASATHAMGEAMRYIRTSEADVVYTGGSEAALTSLALAAFTSMKALSTRNDDPTIASRPFDRDRDGFVLAEGAGACIFEELEHAKKRNAPILAEVIGFGATSDSEHITQPSESGVGAAKAMTRAVEDAKIPFDRIDYINAHGTSTPLGDLAETTAIKNVFKSHAKKLVVSSSKSAVGHTLGASGGMEFVAIVRAVQNSVIPPTINFDNPGEGCDLDYCPNHARDRQINTAMSNSFGFGGHNACIIIKKYE